MPPSAIKTPLRRPQRSPVGWATETVRRDMTEHAMATTTRAMASLASLGVCPPVRVLGLRAAAGIVGRALHPTFTTSRHRFAW